MKKLAAAALLLLAGSSSAFGQAVTPAYHAPLAPSYGAADSSAYGRRYDVPAQYPREAVTSRPVTRGNDKVFSNYDPQPQSNHEQRQAQNERLMFLQNSL
ncbi:MAG: hypothetical protein WDN72_00345 [Alphaproteobacteria bacterium]